MKIRRTKKCNDSSDRSHQLMTRRTLLGDLETVNFILTPQQNDSDSTAHHCDYFLFVCLFVSFYSILMMVM